MASNRKNALLWTAAGLLLSVVALALVFCGLKGTVLITDEENIPITADAVLSSIEEGDWDALSALVSGNPDLKPQLPEDGTAERLIWNAYLDSLLWETEESYKLDGSRINLNVTVACLDIVATTQILRELPLDASLDRNAQLAAAAEQLLATELPTIHRTITLTLIRENGCWVMIPNNALLALMSGFTAP